jgi:hypothetical protein
MYNLFFYGRVPGGLKERLEIWIPIITALAGLIGVFIILINIIKSR